MKEDLNMTKSEYFKGKVEHLKEMIAHHADMADKGIHIDYHKQQEAKHRQTLDKLERKSNDMYNPSNRASGAAVTGPVGPAATTGGSISTPSPF